MAASQSLFAIVAELADAHGSGPCTRKGVGVRVPSMAPRFLVDGSSSLMLLFSAHSATFYMSEDGERANLSNAREARDGFRNQP